MSATADSKRENYATTRAPKGNSRAARDAPWLHPALFRHRRAARERPAAIGQPDRFTASDRRLRRLSSIRTAVFVNPDGTSKRVLSGTRLRAILTSHNRR